MENGGSYMMKNLKDIIITMAKEHNGRILVIIFVLCEHMDLGLQEMPPLRGREGSLRGREEPPKRKEEEPI
jgi:hypothetical protein